jgi:hypothetical protein
MVLASDGPHSFTAASAAHMARLGTCYGALQWCAPTLILSLGHTKRICSVDVGGPKKMQSPKTKNVNWSLLLKAKRGVMEIGNISEKRAYLA